MRLRLPVLLVLAVLAGDVCAQALQVAGERQALVINLKGGLPARWEVCTGPCTDPASRRERLLRAGPGGNRVDWLIAGDADATAALAALPYTYEVVQGEGTTTVIVTSALPWDGIRLIHRYRLRRDGTVLEASVQKPAGATLQLAGGDDLVPTALPGLGSIYSRATAVIVGADGADRIDTAPGSAHDLQPGDWAGLRGRFWTLMVSGGEPLSVVAGLPAPDRPVVTLGRSSGAAGPVELRLYAGPIERGALAAADPRLTGMLYAGLWQPLRWLSSGLQAILGFWQARVGNWGLAIVLLSVTVRLLMWPITFVAGRWQDPVNRSRSLLARERTAVRRDRRGEETHPLTLAVNATHGPGPWYTPKGLAGFLVQVPVFIAALDMLGDQFGLAGARFLWIADLSLPDRLVAFAAPLPFFGSHLNLLPFAMAALTVAASRLQEEPGLDPALRERQRRLRDGVAAALFVLLYTLPAGMVLYWTTNTALHLGVVVFRRLRARPPA
jgi:membrane protein insertase Oxa1/YidC/SpoIIIJ